MVERLVSEESVFCLPGDCFEYPKFMRMVLTLPFDLTSEACRRISEFFSRYYVPSYESINGDAHSVTINSSNGKKSYQEDEDQLILTVS